MDTDEWEAILARPAHLAAPRLLGSYLIRELEGQTVTCRIVETEAYDQSDVASHSYRGKTPRTAVMFGPPGHLYVYFTYGMHYCCNVVTGTVGHGSAVLLRALEPLDGYANNDLLTRRRSGHSGTEVTNGPAKLCQALDIDSSWNGHYLRTAPLRLELRPPMPANQIVQSTRVGISRGKDLPWRFYIRGNSFISKV